MSAVFNKLLACGDQDETRSLNLDAQANLSQLQLAASKSPQFNLAKMLAQPQFQMQVTKKDAFGNLPLHYSAQAGFPAGLEMLLEINEDKSGADITATNCNGRTALHVLADRGDLESIQLLLRAVSWGESDRARFIKRYVDAKRLPPKKALVAAPVGGADGDLEMVNLLVAEGGADATTTTTADLTSRAEQDMFQYQPVAGFYGKSKRPYTRILRKGIIHRMVHKVRVCGDRSEDAA